VLVKSVVAKTKASVVTMLGAMLGVLLEIHVDIAVGELEIHVDIAVGDGGGDGDGGEVALWV
jgi:hypothetical protein